jgi:hypothetical protein
MTRRRKSPNLSNKKIESRALKQQRNCSRGVFIKATDEYHVVKLKEGLCKYADMTLCNLLNHINKYPEMDGQRSPPPHYAQLPKAIKHGLPNRQIVCQTERVPKVGGR